MSLAYCDKWRLVGLVIGLAPFLLTLAAIVWVARKPDSYWLALLNATVTAGLLLFVTVPGSLILWNGVKPATCDRTL